MRSKVGTYNSRNAPTPLWALLPSSNVLQALQSVTSWQLWTIQYNTHKWCVNTITNISFSSILFYSFLFPRARYFFRPNSDSLSAWPFWFFLLWNEIASVHLELESSSGRGHAVAVQYSKLTANASLAFSLSRSLNVWIPFSADRIDGNNEEKNATVVVVVVVAFSLSLDGTQPGCYNKTNQFVVPPSAIYQSGALWGTIHTVTRFKRKGFSMLMSRSSSLLRFENNERS